MVVVVVVVIMMMMLVVVVIKSVRLSMMNVFRTSKKFFQNWSRKT